jgi:20S proteasome alpha/beta subunit
VEYATRSVLQGALAAGVACRDGVILVAADARQSPLLLRHSVKKVAHVGGAVAAAVSGLQPDGRLLLKQMR